MTNDWLLALEEYVRKEFPIGSYGHSAAMRILAEAKRIARRPPEMGPSDDCESKS